MKKVVASLLADALAAAMIVNAAFMGDGKAMYAIKSPSYSNVEDHSELF